MQEYKVRYQQLDGFHVSDWMYEKEARRFFNKLKNEKELVTVWAELCTYDEEHDEVVVVEDFERDVINLMGYDIIV